MGRQMKKYMMSAALTALCAGTAMAGGVDRGGQSLDLLFQNGNYAEVGFASITPKISGTLGGVSSGDMVANYSTFTFGYKRDLNDRFSIAVQLSEPYGADVDYPTDSGYVLAGTTAEINNKQLAIIGRYKFDENFSVHAGLRYETVSGEANIVAPGAPLPYTLETSTSSGLGYLIGAAYEKPEIALRVALTYFSSIDHTLKSNETFPGAPAANGEFETTSPTSINLDFQSGVAANTLVFGQIRYVKWTEFALTPALYRATVGRGASDLLDYEDDTITYKLGVGRKFSDSFAGSIALGYEKATGTPTGNLGPTDGNKSIQLGLQYTTPDNIKLSGGITYVKVGGATTSIGAKFEDNTAIGVGFKIGFNF